MNAKGDLVIPDQPCWTSAALAHLWTAWTFLLNSPTLWLIEQPEEHRYEKGFLKWPTAYSPKFSPGSGRVRKDQCRWKVIPWVDLQTEDPISKLWPARWWMTPLLQAERKSLRLSLDVWRHPYPSMCGYLPGSCLQCFPEQDCETRRQSQSSNETTRQQCYSDPGQRVPEKTQEKHNIFHIKPSYRLRNKFPLTFSLMLEIIL